MTLNNPAGEGKKASASEELMVFADEPQGGDSSVDAQPWKVLVVDDEPDIALVLLDVVMENEQAGLELVCFIREDLRNHEIQIVIRTGQPGSAPEERVILDYDINQYCSKADLSETRFLTCVIGALRAFHYIQDSKRHAEEKMLAETAALAKGKFLAYMSHEICTPLNAMIGATELLAAQTLLPEQQENLDIVKQSGQTLLGIVNEVFPSSKPARWNWSPLTWILGNWPGEYAAYSSRNCPVLRQWFVTWQM